MTTIEGSEKMYEQRRALYSDLENRLNSKLLVYITSDKPGFETQIGQDVIDFFIEQLDKIGIVDKISLLLYTRGGDTAAAWNIVNLIKQYCEHFEVVIPHKAHSAGTLISIGANSIIMTKQATLGPIDPSVNNPLNPQIPNAPLGVTFPVSVEAVKGYLEFAKEELRIKDDMALSNILIKLADMVHPLVLGQVYRSRAQIKMLAEKLLKNQISDMKKIQKIISFLCSDSGSHDYTINRREAKTSLGLNIVKPDDEMYILIKNIYDSISSELEFTTPFDPSIVLTSHNGEYEVKRGLIESTNGGSSYFLTKGKFSMQMINGQPNLQDNRIFEGWKYEPCSNKPNEQFDQQSYKI